MANRIVSSNPSFPATYKSLFYKDFFSLRATLQTLRSVRRISAAKFSEERTATFSHGHFRQKARKFSVRHFTSPVARCSDGAAKNLHREVVLRP